jgi:hypothetical protein
VSHKVLLDSLKDGQKVEVETLTELHQLFVLPEEIIEDNNRRRILDAIQFENMDLRFENVFTATDTFQWCLHRTEVPDSQPDLKISFPDWLAKGKGIFHISGKLGSGKSTLMKYIIREKETERLLLLWAGERTLRIIQFFFWNPGTSLQKSLEGLLRCLVHALLESLPHLIPIVFPEHWNPRLALPWLRLPKIKIGYEAIMKAFQCITNALEEMSNYCFCFFIDGLDEFDDPNPMENHTLLAKNLLSWTTRNPDSIKLCVSSREEDAFINAFSADQRLRLHLLTTDDMRRTAITFLEQHDWFMTWDLQARQKIIDDIVSRANGVFLWLVCALQDLSTALEQNLDPAYLTERLEFLPEQVDELFRKTVNSIPRQDRKEAWAIFAIMTAMENFNLSERLNLLDYSFVRHLVKPVGFWTDFERFLRDLKPSSVEDRVMTFKARLRGLCRGLVDVEGRPPNESLTFTHRSISEHFENNLQVGSDIQSFFDSFNVQTAVIQCLAIWLKLVPSAIVQLPEMQKKWLSMLGWLRRAHIPHHLEQLGFLEDILLEVQHEGRRVAEPAGQSLEATTYPTH